MRNKRRMNKRDSLTPLRKAGYLMTLGMLVLVVQVSLSACGVHFDWLRLMIGSNGTETEPAPQTQWYGTWHNEEYEITFKITESSAYVETFEDVFEEYGIVHRVGNVITMVGRIVESDLLLYFGFRVEFCPEQDIFTVAGLVIVSTRERMYAMSYSGYNPFFDTGLFYILDTEVTRVVMTRRGDR